MTQSICTANQARQADTLAIQQYRIPSLLLMEHAAQQCFSLLKKRLQNARSSVIVCGPGNNGADGLAIARLCKDHKIQCTVFLPDPCHLSMDEKIQWDMIQALDIPHISDLEPALKKIEQADVIIDALFGNGLDRPIQEPYSKIIQTINASNAFVASIDIAKQKGPFGAYQGSDWQKGIILGKTQVWFNANSKYKKEWNEIYENLQKYGIRNSQISAIAPNTSSSLIQGCTASVLPIYSKFFVETHGKGSIPNCPPFIKDKFWFYQENRNIDQRKIIEIMARINKWIDTGISIELMYNLNRDIRARDIYETIMKAWKNEIKTLYYTRTIQKDGSSAAKEECVSCAG